MTSCVSSVSGNKRRCGLIHITPPLLLNIFLDHDDVIKWKHVPRYWPFVWGIHRSPVNSPHKGQWRGTLMFSLICARINAWVNNREAGDLRRHRVHYDVIVIISPPCLADWTHWRYCNADDLVWTIFGLNFVIDKNTINLCCDVILLIRYFPHNLVQCYSILRSRSWPNIFKNKRIQSYIINGRVPVCHLNIMPPIINTLRTCGATIVGLPVNGYYTGSEILIQIQAFPSHKISKYRLQISAIFHKRSLYSF